VDVRNKIRAYDPNPGVRAKFGDIEVKLFGACDMERILSNPFNEIEVGKIVKINKNGALIKTSDNGLWVSHVQFPGKGRITFGDAKMAD